jgi:GTP-binding protein
MIPSDADDIRKEYEILHNELVQYNPELLTKSRVLAITKSDMLDKELISALSEDLPEGIPAVFISSLTGQGLTELKDVLWKELNKETFHLTVSTVKCFPHFYYTVLLIQCLQRVCTNSSHDRNY